MSENIDCLERTDQFLACDSNLSQRSRAREAVYHLSATDTERISRTNKHLVTGHSRRICEEQECTCNQRYIKYIITCTAKYFFGKNNCKCSSYGDHPQRSVNRDDHRDQDTGNQKTFLDFFLLHLGNSKLDTQTYHIRNNDFRQYSQKTKNKSHEKSRISSYCKVMLITDIVHTKKQSGQQSNDDHGHRTLRVNIVMNVYA